MVDLARNEDMVQLAELVRQHYLEMKRVGFNEHEALELTKTFISASISRPIK